MPPSPQVVRVATAGQSGRPPQAQARAAAVDARQGAIWRLTASAALAGAVLLAGTGLARAQMEPATAEQGDIIVSHGISTFDELELPVDFPHLRYVNPDAPKGGEMSIWAMGTFTSMHPYTTSGTAGALSSIFFESLLESTADEIGASYCLVCETLEYPADRSWVIFNLRPEARFSDGSPLTADDVLFSYEILLEKGLPDFRVVLRQQVESVEVLGPHRIRYNFNADFPTRDLPQTVGSLPIFSRAFYEENGLDFEQSLPRPLLGSGPYVLDQVDMGRTIIYRRNPDYWGVDLPINRGRANFDRIRVVYYADYDVAFEGFTAGTYHFRTEARAALWAEGYNFPALTRGHVVREELPDGSMASGQSFIFNMRRDRFQDPRVRQAIEMMFNFTWSNETLFHGLYARIESFWENSHMAADGPPTPEELALLEPVAHLLAPGILTDDAVRPAVSGDRQLDRTNLQRAGALLDEAGWIVQPPPPQDPRLPLVAVLAICAALLGAGGFAAIRMKSTPVRGAGAGLGLIAAGAAYWYLGMPVPSPEDGLRRNADGTVLNVEFLNANAGFDRIINPYVENLIRLGIDARMTRVDPAQMTNRERSYDFDIITANFPMSLIPGSGLKQYYGSETADISVFNKMGLKNEGIDALIENVLAAESNESLAIAVRALDRALRAERFWVPQWYKNTHWVAYYDMYEYPDPLPPFSLGHLDFWWFNADKAAALRAAGAIR